MKHPIYILILLLLTSFLSCKDDFENYSTSPNDLLTFSVDTVRLDTILSSVTTPIAELKVYNKNSKPLLISSIKLNNAGQSGFRINVDGMAGTAFQDVEIRSNDSLYIFIDANPFFTGQTLPALVQDEIEFLTNTVSQQVVLEAHSQDVTILRRWEVEEDTLLSNELPYLLFDTLFIREGATLEIPEGTTFYMNGTANIVVEGTLKIKGTQDRRVVMRGDRMDNLIATVPYDRVPGQWGGIVFTPTSFGNEIEYAHIRGGKSALYLEPSHPEELKLTIKNSIITNFRGAILAAVNCQVTVENSELSNSRDALAHLVGGSYSFTHCTLANYYAKAQGAGWGNTSNQTVILQNTYLDWSAENSETVLYPIIKADFINTIISGPEYSATSGISIEDNKDSSINFYFRNCLIENKGENDNDFINCIFAEDPLFLKPIPVNEEDEEDFIYIFQLTEESPAKDKADPVAAQAFPLDLNGISRLSDAGSDMGAYEYREQ